MSIHPRLDAWFISQGLADPLTGEPNRSWFERDLALSRPAVAHAKEQMVTDWVESGEMDAELTSFFRESYGDQSPNT